MGSRAAGHELVSMWDPGACKVMTFAIRLLYWTQEEKFLRDSMWPTKPGISVTILLYRKSVNPLSVTQRGLNDFAAVLT